MNYFINTGNNGGKGAWNGFLELRCFQQDVSSWRNLDQWRHRCYYKKLPLSLYFFFKKSYVILCSELYLPYQKSDFCGNYDREFTSLICSQSVLICLTLLGMVLIFTPTEKPHREKLLWKRSNTLSKLNPACCSLILRTYSAISIGCAASAARAVCEHRGG